MSTMLRSPGPLLRWRTEPNSLPSFDPWAEPARPSHIRQPYLVPSYFSLPPEIRFYILTILLHEGPSSGHDFTRYTHVCREWQSIVEGYTFADLSVSSSQIRDFRFLMTSPSRRRCLKKIRLHIELPPYDYFVYPPHESLFEQAWNNHLFTCTISELFFTLVCWKDEDFNPGGITLILSAGSSSDPVFFGISDEPNLYHRKLDMCQRRFGRSLLDIVTYDQHHTLANNVWPSRHITGLESDCTNHRAFMPSAYSEIMKWTPCLRRASLHIPKPSGHGADELLRAMLTETAYSMQDWPMTLERLSIEENPTSVYHKYPTEYTAESGAGISLCGEIRLLAEQLNYLCISNLVCIRDFLSPVWPVLALDHEILQEPTLPNFWLLERVFLEYGALEFKNDWNPIGTDINEDPLLIEFRHSMTFALARLAIRLPKLSRMHVAQRSMLWAGEHDLVYQVDESAQQATLSWQSTFAFEFRPITLIAWEGVAALHEVALKVDVKIELEPSYY